jgi:HlyD family secretion protein
LKHRDENDPNHVLIPSEARDLVRQLRKAASKFPLSLRSLGMRCALALAFITACKEETPPPPYQAVPVERRDIVVSAQASGAIQPDTTVEVKSKASGEIQELRVETGQVVKRGDLMVRVDPRIPRNAVAQAQADLEVAQARLANAASQRRRADELFKSQSITEQEHEQALLDYANANAEVVRARVSLDNARDQLDDTNVRAPINGTIIEKQVERGQVISSPTNDVGGGTVLLKMADLNLVQVRTLVDETDIGKIQPGQRATVTVEAFPQRPFSGTVLKIEPQAQTEQNVTMFPVLVRIDNKEGLLRPGMNAEVEIHVGRRDDVLAVPTAALRTRRDVGSAAQVLGLSEQAVQKALAAGPEGQRGQRGRLGQVTAGAAGSEGQLPEASETRRQSSGGVVGSTTAGTRPRRITAAAAPAGAPYIVFVRRDNQTSPVWIRTGLSDLDYSEVVDGLTAGDSVLILPSTDLVQSQQEARERINRFTGGGLPGMRQQTPPSQRP